MIRSALIKQQRGLSLIGLLLFGIIAVMFVVIGMRVLPTVLEYMAVERTLERIATSGESTPSAIRTSFDRAAAIDDIASITGRDLKIDRSNGGSLVSYEYEKRVPLFGPASLLLEYKGSRIVGSASR